MRTAVGDFGFTNGFDVAGEYVAVAMSLYRAMTRTLIGVERVAGPPGTSSSPTWPPPSEDFLGRPEGVTFGLAPGVKSGAPAGTQHHLRDVPYALQRFNTAPLVGRYRSYYFSIVTRHRRQGKVGQAPDLRIRPPTPRRSSPAWRSRTKLPVPLRRATPPDSRGSWQEIHQAGDYGRYMMSNTCYMIQGSQTSTSPPSTP